MEILSTCATEPMQSASQNNGGAVVGGKPNDPYSRNLGPPPGRKIFTLTKTFHYLSQGLARMHPSLWAAALFGWPI
jgi:hypothetical protein